MAVRLSWRRTVPLMPSSSSRRFRVLGESPTAVAMPLKVDQQASNHQCARHVQVAALPHAEAMQPAQRAKVCKTDRTCSQTSFCSLGH